MTTVGIVGLGIMGGAIARNLLAAGAEVRGYDIDAARFGAGAGRRRRELGGRGGARRRCRPDQPAEHEGAR
jgi:3-hydroxyacyl-CoA dehydrogenase